MINVSVKGNCSGCHACASVCPKKCITMKRDPEGFLYPHADNSVCVECGLCEKVCPLLNRETKKEKQYPEAYAVVNSEAEIRETSSSGGVFTLIAEYILEQGGVVFGAAFNDKNEVEHIYTEDKKELYKLRGAKYVQSLIGDTYVQAKAFLEDGKKVLYTGTPCQIGGLKSFLGKEYDNLFCQDIICHGVPSPDVWKKYLEYREKKAGSKIKEISFRNKKHGWKKYSVKFIFENNSVYSKKASEDLYMRGYLSDLCLRPSCYQCEFKSLERQADITLADFWGIENIIPKMDDDKGTSLVLVHSEKGAELLSEVCRKAEAEVVDLQKAVSYNGAAVKSTRLPELRENFLKDIKTGDFEKVVNLYTVKKSFVKKVLRKCLRIVKRK